MTAAEMRGAVSRGVAAVGRLPDHFLDRIARLPSTNFRIAVSLGVFIATTGRYLTARDGWAPSVEWLAFLATSLGLDVLQFRVKRRSQHENGRSQIENGDPPA